MPIIETSVSEGTSMPRAKIARGIYDFASDGGAVSTIALMGATTIPSGATITGGFIEVHTALTSGGAATIAVQVNAANDIVPAVAVASWTTGVKSIVPVRATSNTLAAANLVRTTAARDISIVIAAAALTAGRFSVVVEYVDSLT